MCNCTVGAMFVILRFSLLGTGCAFYGVLVRGTGVVVTKGLEKVMNKKAASVSRGFPRSRCRVADGSDGALLEEQRGTVNGR